MIVGQHHEGIIVPRRRREGVGRSTSTAQVLGPIYSSIRVSMRVSIHRVFVMGNAGYAMGNDRANDGDRDNDRDSGLRLRSGQNDGVKEQRQVQRVFGGALRAA